MPRLGHRAVGLFVPIVTLGCNPLVFENILDDAHVVPFEIRGPSGSVHGRHVLVYPPEAVGEDGHAAIAAGRGASFAWMNLSSGGKAVASVIDTPLADALAFPIESEVNVIPGGMARVPDPTDANRPHALVALLSPAEPFLSRIVRFRPLDFSRVDPHEEDIEAPKIGDVTVPGFASHMAAINLDAAQDDPDYEVAVGSEQGVLVYDNLHHNRMMYNVNKVNVEFNDSQACAGDKEPDCFFFTLCTDLTAINGIAAAEILPGGDAAFMVGTPTGITFITLPATPTTNAVGAPVFDCAADVRVAPAGASETFGSRFLVEDLDMDGHRDLAVGDPGANRVFLFQGSPMGLEDAPGVTLAPEDPDAVSYGTGIGVSDLGGNLGHILTVGAPGTKVKGKENVGAAFVYERDIFNAPPEPIVVLKDENPASGTQHGMWVGGLSIGEREELIVMGRNEGRVHLKINPLDPRPGD